MDETIKPNYEIRRKNFQGTLPIQVSLDDSDLYPDKEIPTYYVMQSRMSYFFLIIPELIKFYSEYLDLLGVKNDDYWLSWRGEPLRFDVPIGVLYDTLVRKEFNGDSNNLPFKIFLHYRNFPTQTLQKGMMKHIFQQSLKESSLMRVGKASIVQDRLDLVRSMLNAIKEGKYDDFWRCNEEIGEQSLEQLKFFPVRIVINKNYHPFMLQNDKDTLKSQMCLIQRPIKAKNKDMWVGEYLARVLPKYFEIQTEVIVNEDEPQDEEGKKTPEEEEHVVNIKKGTEVIVNGLPIDLDISLTWLIINLSALDNFLYISIRIPNENND